MPNDHVAIYEPRAGVLRPEATISRSVTEALEHGAHVHGRERVIGWDAGDGGVEVRTERDRYAAARLVLAGGAWTPGSLGVDVGLTVTRQVLGWVWPSRPELFKLGAMPIWGVGRGGGTLDYGFPIIPGRPGFKLVRIWRNLLRYFAPLAIAQVLALGVLAEFPAEHYPTVAALVERLQVYFTWLDVVVAVAVIGLSWLQMSRSGGQEAAGA